MQDYGVRDVERLLRLSRGVIRSLVQAGFVTPSRGPRNSWRFSFRDLIVLRTAQALAEAKVPKRRITRSVRELRKTLPSSMPLSGLSICAVGDQVAVREGTRRWQADSGQYLLEFEPEAWQGEAVETREPAGPTPLPETAEAAVTADEWFDRACQAEVEDTAAAIAAYERVVELDSLHVDARLNLGRLLHESGQLARAEKLYRDALKVAPRDALLHFNLAVLLEDLQRYAEAVKLYHAALALDASLADAHYNLALLYETLRRPKEAIRHLSLYRKLTGTK